MEKCGNPLCWCYSELSPVQVVWYADLMENEEHLPLQDYQCQSCGEVVGYLVRLFQWLKIPLFHKCSKTLSSHSG